MGCLLCCKKKKKNGELVNPLFSEAKEPINEKKDISIIDEETTIEIKEQKEEKPNYIIVENTKYSDKGLNLNENIGDDELLLKEDSPLICEYEKGIITFTINGFVNLYNSLWDLENYKSIYDKDDLSILIRYEGTPMNSKFYLIKVIYKLKKSDLKYNHDIDSIIDYCYDVKFRMLWDDALKSYDKYEGTDNAFIFRYL